MSGSGLRLLFVCTANQCRSPYLELYARHRLRPELAETVRISSAGTHAGRPAPIDPELAPELDRLGLDGSSHRSRQLDRRLVDEADLVVCAAAEHRTWILADQPAAVSRVWTLGQLAQTLEQTGEPAGDQAGDRAAERGLGALSAAFRKRAPAGRDSDVADPFGRGPEAVREATALMREWSDLVLARLDLADPSKL